MTSLPIHLSNHWPQALECNLSSRCNHQRKNENYQQRKSPSQTDEETEGTADKEVKDFFAKMKEKRNQEELETKKMKVVMRDSRLS
jgi:hypothetical protein